MTRGILSAREFGIKLKAIMQATGRLGLGDAATAYLSPKTKRGVIEYFYGKMGGYAYMTCARELKRKEKEEK